MQRNWIGKSRGTRVRFNVDGARRESIEVFTTRVDTIYGASALILAPEHPLLASLIEGHSGQSELEENISRLRRALKKAADIAMAEKEGFFTGRYAVNPFNDEKIPIWVGNFVLMEYGTGAVMCVPAHDDGAARFLSLPSKYGLPIPIVVAPKDSNQSPSAAGMIICLYRLRNLRKLGPYSGLPPISPMKR